MLLTTLALMLVIDIDRPGRGGIRESQGPMEWLRDYMRETPPQSFDRLTTDPPPRADSPGG